MVHDMTDVYVGHVVSDWLPLVFVINLEIVGVQSFDSFQSRSHKSLD